MCTDTDAELLRRAKADQNQYIAIYDRYLGELTRYCRRFLRDQSASRCVAHDTLTLGMLRMDNIDEAGSLKGWLYTTARHACFKRIRQLKGGIVLFVDQELELTSVPPPHYDKEVIYYCMGKLLPLDQHIVLLKTQDEWTFQEIGKSMVRSTSNIKQRFDNAIKGLRLCLQKNKIFPE